MTTVGLLTLYMECTLSFAHCRSNDKMTRMTPLAAFLFLPCITHFSLSLHDMA